MTMSQDCFQAAAVQLSSREDKQANLRAATQYVELAARRGAKLVALPEMFNCLGQPQVMLDQAEEIPGPTSDLMAALARRLGSYAPGRQHLRAERG